MKKVVRITVGKFVTEIHPVPVIFWGIVLGAVYWLGGRRVAFWIALFLIIIGAFSSIMMVTVFKDRR